MTPPHIIPTVVHRSSQNCAVQQQRQQRQQQQSLHILMGTMLLRIYYQISRGVEYIEIKYSN